MTISWINFSFTIS